METVGTSEMSILCIYATEAADLGSVYRKYKNNDTSNISPGLTHEYCTFHKIITHEYINAELA